MKHIHLLFNTVAPALLGQHCTPLCTMSHVFYNLRVLPVPGLEQREKQCLVSEFSYFVCPVLLSGSCLSPKVSHIRWTELCNCKKGSIRMTLAKDTPNAVLDATSWPGPTPPSGIMIASQPRLHHVQCISEAAGLPRQSPRSQTARNQQLGHTAGQASGRHDYKLSSGWLPSVTPRALV